MLDLELCEGLLQGQTQKMLGHLLNLAITSPDPDLVPVTWKLHGDVLAVVVLLDLVLGGLGLIAAMVRKFLNNLLGSNLLFNYIDHGGKYFSSSLRIC